mmetsp:Transcript_35456/g.105865  ORF Transcript_35456/g.105865 Transcript_35456/m.105865 type:complete len:177 (+) Transcript_35456:97-627(+)
MAQRRHGDAATPDDDRVTQHSARFGSLLLPRLPPLWCLVSLCSVNLTLCSSPRLSAQPRECTAKITCQVSDDQVSTSSSELPVCRLKVFPSWLSSRDSVCKTKENVFRWPPICPLFLRYSRVGSTLVPVEDGPDADKFTAKTSSSELSFSTDRTESGDLVYATGERTRLLSMADRP